MDAELAGLVKVDRASGTVEVDGQVVPWLLADDWCVDAGPHISKVTVTILAEAVQVS